MNETALIILNFSIVTVLISIMLFILLPLSKKKGIFKNGHYWTAVVTFYFFHVANFICTIHFGWNIDPTTKLEKTLNNVSIAGIFLSLLMLITAVNIQDKKNKQVKIEKEDSL